MPKSKRDKKIALTKTQKKFGLEGKQVSNYFHSEILNRVIVYLVKIASVSKGTLNKNF